MAVLIYVRSKFDVFKIMRENSKKIVVFPVARVVNIESGIENEMAI